MKKLKTHKRVCSLLFSLILGLALLGGFSLNAFASNEDWTEIAGGMTIDNISYSVNQGAPVEFTLNGTTRYKTDVTVTLSWRQYYLFDYFYTYFGYVDLAYNIWLQLGYNQSGNQFFEYRVKDIVTENPNTKVTASNPWVSTEGGRNYINLGSIRITEFLNENLYETGQNNCSVSVIYEFVYSPSNVLNTFQKYWDSCQVMYNKLYMTKNTALTLNDIRAIDSNIYSTLVDIYGFQQNDLTWKLDDIIYYLTDMSYGFVNDASGTSDNLNSQVSSAAAVESAADGAISNALPDADNELDDILDYDYSSIGTSNLTALSFWKQLGDYILSNSNLVGIGALLVGCLFLGFVIYLLRL